MPVTFPAHAAAILPFRAVKWLPGTALVVGSAAPDYAFLMGGTAGEWSHRPSSLLLFCVPVGLLLYLALESVILPALRETSPWLSGLLASRGPPQGGRKWGAATVGILLGAVTHLLFDAFTHGDRWPGNVLFSKEGAARAHLLASIFASLFVLAWAVRHARRSRDPGAKGDGQLAALLLSATFFGAMTANLVSDYFAFGHPTLGRGWKIFAGAFLGALIAAALRNVLRRGRLRAPRRV